MLLAVDLGLRTGLAAFDARGRLQWYRSQHFGNVAALRRGSTGVVRECVGLRWLFAEGDRALGEIWEGAARYRGADYRLVSADIWRQGVLTGKQRATGAKAKHSADGLARWVIDQDGAKRPTSLRHDAAEAIALGYWATLELGWRR